MRARAGTLRLLEPRRIAALAVAGSLALLVGALLFEHVGGLAPCPLCLWQRWPHAAAALAGLAVLALPLRPTMLAGVAPLRPVALAGLALMAASAGLGGYHAGIEWGWWQGPTACAAPDIAGLSADELFERIMAAPVVRCDEVAWSLLGLSMAGWNALASLGLAGLWAAAYASSSASQ